MKWLATLLLASSFAHGVTVVRRGTTTVYIPDIKGHYLHWDYIQQAMPIMGSTFTPAAASSLYAAVGTNGNLTSAVVTTGNTVTSTGNSTGAKLAIVAVAHGLALDTFTVTDNKSNTITCNTIIFTHTGTSGIDECYIINGTFGSSHTVTFTLTSVTTTRAAIGLFPYSYSSTTPTLDLASAGAFAAGSAVSPGSITPAGNSELYTVLSSGNGIGASAIVVASPCVVPTGGTVTAQWDALYAALPQGTAAALNCQVTYTGDTSVIAIGAFFK